MRATLLGALCALATRLAFVGVAAATVATAACTTGVAANCDEVNLLQSKTGQHAMNSKDVVNEKCDINDLNEGLCDGLFESCFECDLQGTDNVLPTDAQRFPQGRLLCSGGLSCSLVDGSKPVTFKDPSQVMVCTGENSCHSWTVDEFGALCCSSSVNVGSSCLDSNFELEPTPLCQNDVCCDGWQVCVASDFNGIESLLCRGFETCYESSFTLTRDLYCNETSPLTPDPSEFGSTCKGSTFAFSGEQHVVDCLGNDVCSTSTFTFTGDNAKISMVCNSQADGTQQGGTGGACLDSTITLSPGDCLDLNCTQEPDCAGMTVNVNGGTCYFFGPGFPPDGCDATQNSTQCGEIPPDEICCKDDELCGSCCEEPSSTTTPIPDPNRSTTTTGPNTTTTAPVTTTTTTTTTTSSKKKPPYPYNRRNRRQHRRDRRQHRRQQRREHRREYRYQYG